MILVGLLGLACGPAGCVVDQVRGELATLEDDRAAPVMACDDANPGPAPDRCLSGKVRCGDRVSGTTGGGDSAMGREFYAAAFCFPATDGHEGPERAYLLQAPPNQKITITLDSDCVDLDVAALSWAYDGTCPTVNHPIAECTASTARGGGEVVLNTFHARDYLVVVDGKNDAVGPFRLRVDCEPLAR